MDPKLSSLLMVAAFLTAGVLAGCLGADDPAASQSDDGTETVAAERDPTSPLFKPHVVVAVVDTGNNPYHSEYAEQYDASDPATYIPGYPDDVIPLTLSEWEKTVADGPSNQDHKDTELWADTKPGALYRFVGTKIVGHISFSSSASLPGSGHGTMTSSRATGNTISVGGPAIRLVHVQGFTEDGIRWAADQPWIDMISISSGLSAGGLVPGASNVMTQSGMETFQYAAHKKPFFASSGNGVGNVGMLGFPSWTRGPSGVPDVISVGANENGKMNVWHNFHPYIVGDGCGNPSAQDNSADEIDNTGGGTSSATPFSAGTGAAMLLEARRLLGDTHVGARWSDQPIESFSDWDSLSPADPHIIMAQGDPTLHGITSGPLADGVFTAEEFKDVLYHTAISGGTDDESDGDDCVLIAQGTVPGDQVPEPVRAQYNGYGEVNAKSMEFAFPVLAGAAENPARPMDDMWYERFHTFKSTTMPPD